MEWVAYLVLGLVVAVMIVLTITPCMLSYRRRRLLREYERAVREEIGNVPPHYFDSMHRLLPKELEEFGRLLGNVPVAFRYADTTVQLRDERRRAEMARRAQYRRDLASRLLRPKTERWLISLSFWIPRRHREAATGDILEDCHEMREKGFSERRIRVHVLWQFVIAVIALWPEAVGSAVAAIVKRVWSTKK